MSFSTARNKVKWIACISGWKINQSINQGLQMLIHINSTYIEEVPNISLPLGKIGNQDLMAWSGKICMCTIDWCQWKQIRAQLGTMRSRIPQEDMCSRAHAKTMKLHILVLISWHTEKRWALLPEGPNKDCTLWKQWDCTGAGGQDMRISLMEGKQMDVESIPKCTVAELQICCHYGWSWVRAQWGNNESATCRSCHDREHFEITTARGDIFTHLVRQSPSSLIRLSVFFVQHLLVTNFSGYIHTLSNKKVVLFPSLVAGGYFEA